MINDMDDIEFKISQLIDNELTDEEQAELFLILSGYRQARQTLSDFMQMKKDTFRYYANISEEMPTLPLNIPRPHQEPGKSGFYRPVMYIASAAAVILLMLLAWQQRQADIRTGEYNFLKQSYIHLKSDYNTSLEKALLNGQKKLSGPDVALVQQNNRKAEKVLNLKPAIHEAKATKEAKDSQLVLIKKDPKLAYLSKAPVEEITKSDFLIPQLPGN